MAAKRSKKKKPNWYARWKLFPHHGQVHWLVLGALVWSAGLLFLSGIIESRQEGERLSQVDVLGVSTRVERNLVREEIPTITIPEGEVRGESVSPVGDIYRPAVQRNYNSINVPEESKSAETQEQILGVSTGRELTADEYQCFVEHCLTEAESLE